MAGRTSLPSTTPEQFDGSLMRDDSDGLSHMLSQVSNDSIKQLIKLASCGFEEDFVLEDIDLSDFCQAWDASVIPEIPPTPVDLQMEMDIMHRHMHHGFDQNNDMPCCDDMTFHEASYPSMYAPNRTTEGQESNERCLTGNMEPKAMPQMDVKKPRVNLVVGSNVVHLNSDLCPKPSVRVLSSHVIQTPQMPVHTQTAAAPYHSTGHADDSGCLPPTDGWNGEGYNWSLEEESYGMEQMPVYDAHPPALYQVRARGIGCGAQGPYREMMMMDDVQPPNPFLAHVGFDDSAHYDPMPMFERTDEDGHGAKVLRKNTKGDKEPGYTSMHEQRTVESVAERLDACQIESRSTEISKIQSMTEAEICNYVKSMAPQLQNNAWEEIVKETKFEDRLVKAEHKMQQHTNELEHIRQQVARGELDPKEGTELMRKVYNCREAAASRTRREQGLVKAAIKKRTLEKICSWMREHLFGNSELFSMNSLDSDVRRSRSDGTGRPYEEHCVQ